MPVKTPYILISALTAVFLLTAAIPSGADDTTLSSVTSVSSWEREDGQADTAAQYLELYTSHSLGSFNLDISGYGRAASGSDENGETDGLSRLYSLTLGLASPDGSTSLLLGRQFVSSLTGPDQIDGLHVRQVLGDWSLAARYGHISEISSSDANDDVVMGLALDYMIRKNMYFSLDYSRTSDEDALLREQAALDWTYSWHRYTKAYIFFNWDIMSRTIHEALLGTRLYFSDAFTWIIEFSQCLNQFDSDSIYSVFAVDAAKATSFSLLFTPNRNTRYTWEYALESYEGGNGGRRYSIAGKWTPGSATYDLSLGQHSGFGGDLTEIRLSTTQELLPEINVTLGGDITRTETEGDDLVRSYAVNTGLMWSPSDKVSASLKYELSGDDILEDQESTSRLSLHWEL